MIKQSEAADRIDEEIIDLQKIGDFRTKQGEEVASIFFNKLGLKVLQRIFGCPHNYPNEVGIIKDIVKIDNKKYGIFQIHNYCSICDKIGKYIKKDYQRELTQQENETYNLFFKNSTN